MSNLCDFTIETNNGSLKKFPLGLHFGSKKLGKLSIAFFFFFFEDLSRNSVFFRTEVHWSEALIPTHKMTSTCKALMNSISINPPHFHELLASHNSSVIDENVDFSDLCKNLGCDYGCWRLRKLLWFLCFWFFFRFSTLYQMLIHYSLSWNR